MECETDAADFADMAADEFGDSFREANAIKATPYRWPDPKSLPTRQWLLGRWLLRGEVSVMVAPGGVGKSTISNLVALSMATGLPLLEKSVQRGPQGCWIFNLEDGTEELERQVVAACLFHNVARADCGDRLYLDSGLIQPLCTATENKDGFTLSEPVFEQVAATIRDRGISVLIVDPFVSSHGVRENSNEAIDAIVKRWKRLAQETGCAVLIVHHTKKLGDRDATAEDGRGASALPAAARVVLTLNKMSRNEAGKLGIVNETEWRSLVRIDTGKGNRAPPGEATWIKLESQNIGNGDFLEPGDDVAVARIWHLPESADLDLDLVRAVQDRMGGEAFGENCLARDWIGHPIATVAGLCPAQDRSAVQAILRQIIAAQFLKVEYRRANGRDRPMVIVGKSVAEAEPAESPHPEKCGAESAERAAGDPC